MLGYPTRPKIPEPDPKLNNPSDPDREETERKGIKVIDAEDLACQTCQMSQRVKIYISVKNECSLYLVIQTNT